MSKSVKVNFKDSICQITDLSDDKCLLIDTGDAYIVSIEDSIQAYCDSWHCGPIPEDMESLLPQLVKDANPELIKDAKFTTIKEVESLRKQIADSDKNKKFYYSL